MIDLRQGVRNCRIRDQQEHFNSRLQRAVPLNNDLRLPSELKPIADQLFDSLVDTTRSKKVAQKRFDCEILLANLLYQRRRRPVRLTFARNTYGKSRYSNLSLFILELVNMMEAENLIDVKKGYQQNGQKFQSRIWPTKELLKIFKPFPNTVIYEPTELVILTDANGKLKEYRDTKRTKHIRSVLQQANRVNGAADIRIHLDGDAYRLHTFLIAKFSRKFTLHGRLYSKGYFHFQQFNEEERATITINGEPVAELDFSGLHPRLLYAMEGIEYDKDPYLAINPDPIARPFLKVILLRLLNAETRLKAEASANFWLFQNHRERERLKSIGITRARPLIETFYEAHKPIAHYFANGSDNGLRIMNLDSKIALDVVEHFVKKSIPILSIHDSFVVQKRYEDELRCVMQKAYKKHVNGFTCIIK